MKNINPFPTSDYIDPDYFCDRKDELNQLVEAIENQRNTTIVSQRRLGKTALIKHLFHFLSDRKDISLHYFDIYSTQNLREFTNLLCTSLLGYYESKPEKAFQQILKILGQFRPKFSVDELSGRPSIELSLQSDAETGQSLGALFAYLASQQKKIVIAIDEFQQITQYPENNVEALLRTHIQGSNNVSMIYSGSNRHMLLSLFNDYARPFYQSSGFLFLEKLDKEKYKSFIAGHFKASGCVLSEDALNYILDWPLGHTYYVQEICNRLYAASFRRIEPQDVNIIILQIMEERTPLYQIYRDLLTSSQYSLLKALAIEGQTEQPTSSGFVTKYQLGAISTVKRSLEALENKHLIFNEEGKYFLMDVFLMRWLQRQ
jgi:AAA+ ATPase superfamily predicted ATPase